MAGQHGIGQRQDAAETLGNGLTTTRAYDAVDRITSIYTPVVHAQNYVYDALGNVTQRTDGVPDRMKPGTGARLFLYTDGPHNAAPAIWS